MGYETIRLPSYSKLIGSGTDEFSPLERSISEMAAGVSRTTAFAIGGPIARADLPALCERLCALLEESGATIALCDVSAARADLVTVEALARLQLAARRHGGELRLCRASAELLDLVNLMGLAKCCRTGDDDFPVLSPSDQATRRESMGSSGAQP